MSPHRLDLPPSAADRCAIGQVHPPTVHETNVGGGALLGFCLHVSGLRWLRASTAVVFCGAIASAMFLAPNQVAAQTSQDTRSSQAAQPALPTIDQIRSARETGKLESAAEMLLQLDDQSEADLSLEFLLLARDGKTKLPVERLDELYARAAKSLSRSDATPETIDGRCLIRSVAATHFANRQKTQLASKILLDALEESRAIADKLPPDRAGQLITLAMRTAWAELSASRATDAERLYATIVELSARRQWTPIINENIPLSLLGLGWATAMQTDRVGEAAERLKQFIDTYPEHNDAPQAAALRIRCLQQAERSDEAETAIVDFLRRWPENRLTHAIVLNALSSQARNRSTDLAETLERWIVQDGSPQQWPTELVRRAMLTAGPKLSPPRFDEMLRRLASEDETGQQTADLLHESVAADRSAIAEQVAAILISGDLAVASKMSREAACRWAGRTGRWSMLALAAESTDLTLPDPTRSEHVERLFAEALTQTGQGSKAARWWAHLVDERKANDFPTLLRCAETAVAHAEIADATRRLNHVRGVLDEETTQTDSIRTALVDLLAADLAVRNVEFDSARVHLEAVVRNPLSTPAIRGRAQWMIGETYFMQRQFADAIESYRRVEGIDPGGPFIAASLVQAGKSFEQLGLTREAGDCYSALIGRFADSTHAREARRRMAALPNPRGAPPTTTPLTDPDAASPQSSRLRR